MWRDIALANRKNLTRALETYIGELQNLRRVLSRKRDGVISKFFERAKERRDRWIETTG